MNGNAISIKEINKVYGSKAKKIEALKNINLNFEYGKFYLITGHSGSGKSTLLKLLGLIDRPTSGEIYFEDNNIDKMNNKDLAKIRNEKIGYIFQDYYLDKYLTAQENVIIPMIINKKYRNRKEIINKSSILLEQVGLKDRIRHFPKELSGGEQQRVAIARALANNSMIILADEPTGNLDLKNEEFVFKKLKEMSKAGKCVIMVSHSKDAISYADIVIELKEGKVL